MMAIERSEVRFGLTAIPYVVRRSQRRGTVSIAIDPSMGVLLTAPQASPAWTAWCMTRHDGSWNGYGAGRRGRSARRRASS